MECRRIPAARHAARDDSGCGGDGRGHLSVGEPRGGSPSGSGGGAASRTLTRFLRAEFDGLSQFACSSFHDPRSALRARSPLGYRGAGALSGRAQPGDCDRCGAGALCLPLFPRSRTQLESLGPYRRASDLAGSLGALLPRANRFLDGEPGIPCLQPLRRRRAAAHPSGFPQSRGDGLRARWQWDRDGGRRGWNLAGTEAPDRRGAAAGFWPASPTGLLAGFPVPRRRLDWRLHPFSQRGWWCDPCSLPDAGLSRVLRPRLRPHGPAREARGESAGPCRRLCFRRLLVRESALPLSLRRQRFLRRLHRPAPARRALSRILARSSRHPHGLAGSLRAARAFSRLRDSFAERRAHVRLQPALLRQASSVRSALPLLPPVGSHRELAGSRARVSLPRSPVWLPARRAPANARRPISPRAGKGVSRKRPVGPHLRRTWDLGCPRRPGCACATGGAKQRRTVTCRQA